MAPVTRKNSSFPFADIELTHLKKLVIEKLDFQDQLKFTLTSKAASQLTNGGNSVWTEVSLLSADGNFENWKVGDYRTSEKMLIPCSKIVDYPNLRFWAVSVHFLDHAFYRDPYNANQHVISPIQRTWLKDVAQKVSPKFSLGWDEGWNEGENVDVLKEFLQLKPYSISGIIPLSILFPKWDSMSTIIHDSEIWNELRKFRDVDLNVDERVVNSFMKHVELAFMNGVDTGAVRKVVISGRRDTLEWEQFTENAVEGTTTTILDPLVQKCQYPNYCHHHEHGLFFNIPVWISRYQSSTGKTAAIVKNLGWNYCGFYYAFLPDYKDVRSHFIVKPVDPQ